MTTEQNTPHPTNTPEPQSEPSAKSQALAQSGENIEPTVPNEQLIREMENASQRLELANKKYEANQQLANAKKTNKILGGTTEGIGTPKTEETPTQYKERIMKDGYPKQ